MLLQMLDARDSLLDARPMAGRHPPQYDRWPFKMLKPIGAAAIEARMDRPPDKALKCIDALPHRKIDDDTRVGIRPRVSGATALVDIAPDEPGAAFGNAVHQCKIVREICHARIIDLVSNAADIQLCKMMIGWLLQGPTPSPIAVMNSRRLIGFPETWDKISQRIKPKQWMWPEIASWLDIIQKRSMSTSGHNRKARPERLLSAYHPLADEVTDISRVRTASRANLLCPGSITCHSANNDRGLELIPISNLSRGLLMRWPRCPVSPPAL
jgi:hypothetical protein